MARTSTKSSDEATTVNESVVTETMAEENVKEEAKGKEATKNKVMEPLKDSDEINVISLVPNVSYKDSKTGDMYEWDVVGHVESMTFDILKNMWRNHKGYFRELILRPEDERVVNQFGLTKTYEKYEFLMEASNYTRDTIHDICESIAVSPNGLKYSIVNRLKNMVIEGDLTDIMVIRTLENNLKVDLVSFLN